MDDLVATDKLIEVKAQGLSGRVSLSLNLETGEVIVISTAVVENGINQCNVGTTQKVSTGKDNSGPLATFEWPHEGFELDQSFEMYLHLGPKRFDVHKFCSEIDSGSYHLIEPLEEIKTRYPEKVELIERAQEFVRSIAKCELPAGLEKIPVTTVGPENDHGYVEPNGAHSQRVKRIDVAFPISSQGNGLTIDSSGGFTRNS